MQLSVLYFNVLNEKKYNYFVYFTSSCSCNSLGFDNSTKFSYIHIHKRNKIKWEWLSIVKSLSCGQS